MSTSRWPRCPSWVTCLRHVLGVVTLVAIAGVLACGAVVDEHAERGALETERIVLEARITELERALAAAPAVPTPAPGDRLIIRQFTRAAADTPVGDIVIELCLELFGRGDLSAGLPQLLIVSCAAVVVPLDADPVVAIEQFVADPTFVCWSSAVPGVNMPPCWR